MSTPLSVEQIQERLSRTGHVKWLGLQVISADPEKEELKVRAPFRAEFERGSGEKQWHGGPIASIIDTVGDFALIMLLGRGLPTINFRVDYLRPAIDTDLIVVARVRRNGRSVGVSDIDVFNEKGALLAIGRASYSTLTS
jgi:uncharacterized protein (TIGR00369 family)